MPTATTQPLEVAPLLAPIPGKLPAGDARAYSSRLRERFEELRHEDDPNDFDDATRPAVLKRADWQGVQKLAEQALRGETKDFRVACHLLEALVRQQGWSGLQDGLALLAKLADECWDRVNPPLDEEDPDSRGAPLANMLDDPARGLCFPSVVRSLPILGDAVSLCSFTDWQRLQTPSDANAKTKRDAILAATSPERLETVASDAEACLTELTALRNLLDTKLGSYAPSFSHLGEALSDCKTLARQALGQLRPESSNAAADTIVEKPASTAVVKDTSGRPGGLPHEERRAAYEQIQRAAEALARLEPHSPVPYLVQRAVALGSLSFPQMIKQLVREENILSELYRELGIDAATTQA
jgi:type VI secretion system protein ImpA